jgi:Uma2 family endonuclease
MAIQTKDGLKLTYEDYCQFPDDGRRHEIVNGVHVVSPTPVTYHQRLSKRLLLQLAEPIDGASLGEVLYAPVTVQLSPTDIVEPDLLVVLAASRCTVGAKKLEGPPDLVIEILSPGTAKRDRGEKRDLYERSGVREYWIVDPDQKHVEQWVLVGERFASRGAHAAQITMAILPEVCIDLRQVW